MYTSIPDSIEAQWIIWHIQFPKIKLCISTIYHSQVHYGEDFPLSSPLFCMIFQPSPGAASGRIHAPDCTDPSSIENKRDVCLINLMAFLVKDSLNVVYFNMVQLIMFFCCCWILFLNKTSIKYLDLYWLSKRVFLSWSWCHNLFWGSARILYVQSNILSQALTCGKQSTPFITIETRAFFLVDVWRNLCSFCGLSGTTLIHFMTLIPIMLCRYALAITCESPNGPNLEKPQCEDAEHVAKIATCQRHQLIRLYPIMTRSLGWQMPACMRMNTYIVLKTQGKKCKWWYKRTAAIRKVSNQKQCHNSLKTTNIIKKTQSVTERWQKD